MAKKTKDEKFSDKEAKRRFEAALLGARKLGQPTKKKARKSGSKKSRAKAY